MTFHLQNTKNGLPTKLYKLPTSYSIDPKKKFPYFTVLVAYLTTLLPHFLLPSWNYCTNVALTLQPYFTVHEHYVQNIGRGHEYKKVVQEKSPASSAHYFRLWESVCRLQFQVWGFEVFSGSCYSSPTSRRHY